MTPPHAEEPAIGAFCFAAAAASHTHMKVSLAPRIPKPSLPRGAASCRTWAHTTVCLGNGVRSVVKREAERAAIISHATDEQEEERCLLVGGASIVGRMLMPSADSRISASRGVFATAGVTVPAGA